jgi:hypothetical protein
LNFKFDDHCCQKGFCQASFLQKEISPNFANFLNTCTHIFAVGYAAWLTHCMDPYPRKEGGMQVLAGLAPSSQTVGSIVSKAGQKNQEKLKKLVLRIHFNGKILTLESSSIS